MKTSFTSKPKASPKRKTATPDPTPQPEKEPKQKATDKTVAVRPESQVGSALPQQEDMSGSFDRNDVRLPRLNLIHKTSKGELIEAFGIGSFAFEKEVKLSDGTTPLIVTAVRFAKDYQQKLPFGSEQTPATFKTPEEVIANGGSLNYADVKSGNYFGPRGHVQLLIPMPEDASDAAEALFPYEYGDQIFGMGMLTVSSSAYTSVGKELATLRNNNRVMRQGLRFGKLALTSETRTGRGKDWKVPVIKFLGENDADFVKFVESLM